MSVIDSSTENSMPAFEKIVPLDEYHRQQLFNEVSIVEQDNFLERLQSDMGRVWKRHKRQVYIGLGVLVLIGIHVFAIYATVLTGWKKTKALIILIVLAWIACMYYFVLKPFYGEKFKYQVWEQSCEWIDGFYRGNRWATFTTYTVIIIALFLATLLPPLLNGDFRQIVSLGGLAFFWILILVFSKNPRKIVWKPVLGGIILQLTMGLLVLRWDDGRAGFHWLANQIITFLNYTSVGTSFVYGFAADPPWALKALGVEGSFAFTTLQVIIYFGAIVSILYFFGIMQFVLTRLATFVQFAMGTTATESFNAVACIFLGQSEAPLMIRPYLAKMTESEIHCIMTSGFACIAGSLFAAYIGFGPDYILSATVMSAPLSLAVSKMLCPETEESSVKRVEDLQLPPSEERNALEAISNGAVGAVKIVEAIIANLIVFLALLALLDSATGWFIGLLGYEGWNFEKLLGYFFFPIAFFMGVSDAPTMSETVNETLQVAQLLGTKTLLNEFIAYQRLSLKIRCCQLGARAQMMATYALCSFSNFGSIGIQMGTIGGMCPEKKATLSRCALRALFAGIATSLMTTCVAGLMIANPSGCSIDENDRELCNVTMSTMETMMIANYTSTASVISDALRDTAARFLQ